MSERRAQLADAAIATLAREGMRGLTHRAVDRAAGVPEGSTSYYFRTRDALLMATMDRLAELSARDLASLSVGGADSVDVEAIVRLLEYWVTAGRERMIARFELTLESTRRPPLRAVLVRTGTEFRVLAEKLLNDAGVPDAKRRAANLVAHIDGLVFDQVAEAGPQRTHADLRDALIPLFTAAFAP